MFVIGSTAHTATALIGVNKTMTSYYFQRLRQLIYDRSEHLELLEGEVEADESYFGGVRKENEVVVQEVKHQFLAF